MEVFEGIYLDIRDQIVNLSVEKIREMKMMIETRPSFPSHKLTFTIDNLTKDKAINYFEIVLTLNEQYDVDLVLEDSKRNFVNSLESLFFSFYKQFYHKLEFTHNFFSVLLRECYSAIR